MRLDSTRELGRYVRDRRQQLNLTQVQLATKAGVSRRWLSDLEAGKETADIGLVLRTLHALGVVLNAVPERRPDPIDLDTVLERHRHPSPLLERISDADLVAVDRAPEAR